MTHLIQYLSEIYCLKQLTFIFVSLILSMLLSTNYNNYAFQCKLFMISWR